MLNPASMLALQGNPRDMILSLAPWWLSWWYLILGTLAALGLFVLGFQWWMRRVIRRGEHRANPQQDLRALEASALMDPLTGLHNRRFLDPSLAADALQAQRAFGDLLASGRDPLEAKEDILLFMMDLDDFGRVNATWGPSGGDAVLKQLAGTLRDTTRKTDFRGRWEEGKFLLVARRARRAFATTVARNLLAQVRDLAFQLPGGETTRERLSIGFTAFPLHPRHPELGTWQQAVGIAEECLAAAKASGRDRWVGALVDPEADPAPLEGLETWDLAWALGEGLVDVACSEPGFQWPGLPLPEGAPEGEDPPGGGAVLSS